MAVEEESRFAERLFFSGAVGGFGLDGAPEQMMESPGA